MKKITRALLILFTVLFSAPVLAANLDQNLNQEQQERYDKLALEIRCVVCQSEPVATSSAKIALDMRDVIKEHILMGESDDQIRAFFAKQYGEYVLLRPQVNSATYILWGAPLALLVIGGGLFFMFINNKAKYGKADDRNTNNEINDDEALKALKDIED